MRDKYLVCIVLFIVIILFVGVGMGICGVVNQKPYVVYISQQAKDYMIDNNILVSQVMLDVDLGLNAPYNPFGTYFINAQVGSPEYIYLDDYGWGTTDTCVKYTGTNPSISGWHKQIRDISKVLYEGNPTIKAFVYVHRYKNSSGGFIHDSMCVTEGKYFSISFDIEEYTNPMCVISPEELGTFTVSAIVGHEAFHGMTGDIYNSPPDRITLMSMRSLYMDLPDTIRWIAGEKI